MKYIVQAAWVDTDGVVELPDGARILNSFYHPVNGALGVAVLKPLPGEQEEGEDSEEGGEDNSEESEGKDEESEGKDEESEEEDEE